MVTNVKNRGDSTLAALVRFGWQAMMAAGVAALAFGIVLLVWPGETLLVLGVLFGLYLLVTGIVLVFGALTHHDAAGGRVLGIVSGALCILLGLLCFRDVFQSVVLLSIWIGVAWLFRGVSETAQAISLPAMAGRGWTIALGVITAIAGIWLIVNPVSSIETLALVSAIWLIILGVVEIGSAFGLRSAARTIDA